MIPALLAYAARGTSIALFALALQASLRQRGTATSRHLGLTLAAAAMVIEPAIAAVVPAWSVVLRRSQVLAAISMTSRWSSLGWSFLAIWIAGSFIVLCKHIDGYRRAVGMVRRAREIQEPGWGGLVRDIATSAGIEAPLLRVSEELGSPVAFGAWRPVVLLPRRALDWEASRARMTLLHELAHVLRRDGLTQLLAQAITVVHWFNPLAWYLAAQLRHERELAADERVLQMGAIASDYAEHLITVARELAAPPAHGFLAMATRSRLADRVDNVLTFDRACRVHALGRIAMIFAVVLASCTIASFQPIW